MRIQESNQFAYLDFVATEEQRGNALPFSVPDSATVDLFEGPLNENSQSYSLNRRSISAIWPQHGDHIDLDDASFDPKTQKMRNRIPSPFCCDSAGCCIMGAFATAIACSSGVAASIGAGIGAGVQALGFNGCLGIAPPAWGAILGGASVPVATATSFGINRFRKAQPDLLNIKPI